MSPPEGVTRGGSPPLPSDATVSKCSGWNVRRNVRISMQYYKSPGVVIMNDFGNTFTDKFWPVILLAQPAVTNHEVLVTIISLLIYGSDLFFN